MSPTLFFVRRPTRARSDPGYTASHAGPRSRRARGRMARTGATESVITARLRTDVTMAKAFAESLTRQMA
jgi:hypothetical protein